MKKLICLITLLTLVFSLCSCSLINKVFPGKAPDENQNVSNTPTDDGNDDIGETPDEQPETPDLPGGDENPDDPTNKPYDPGVCDCWKDEDGDTICDSCGMGGLIPPICPTVRMAAAMQTVTQSATIAVTAYPFLPRLIPTVFR